MFAINCEHNLENMISLKRAICFPLIALLLSFIFSIITRKPVFSEEVIIGIVKCCIDSKKDVGQKMEAIHEGLKNAYPDHISSKEDLEFSFLTAGGFTVAVYFLHISSHEVLIIFGTVLESTGHSGRYWLNKTDILFNGQMLTWKEGSLEAEASEAGQVFRYHQGEAYIVNFKANMWKVSYMKGSTLTAIPFLFSNYVFVNQDFLSLYRIFKITMKNYFRQILDSIVMFL